MSLRGGYWDSFGHNYANMVALSGDKLLVGAFGEDSGATCDIGAVEVEQP